MTGRALLEVEIIELFQAEPLAVDGHAKVAQIDRVLGTGIVPSGWCGRRDFRHRRGRARRHRRSTITSEASAGSAAAVSAEDRLRQRDGSSVDDFWATARGHHPGQRRGTAASAALAAAAPRRLVMIVGLRYAQRAHLGVSIRGENFAFALIQPGEEKEIALFGAGTNTNQPEGAVFFLGWLF